jgi:RNA polymerase sigma factor (sigma-70 family)
MNAGGSKKATSFVGESYDKYDVRLRRYLERRVRNDQDARELAQEVWTRLLRVGNPQEVLEPLAYIYRAAANVISEYRLRQRRNRVTIDSDVVQATVENPEFVATEEMADELSRQEELDRLMAAMPETFRKILVLKICEGFKNKEIGQQLGLSEGVVETYFGRAMKLVRKGKQERMR